MASGKSIAIIGLGYVGLPLAVEFGKKRNVVGFDIDNARVEDLKKGIDSTLEVDEEKLKDAIYLSFTSEITEISGCQIYIVTVPTPITDKNTPDMRPLESASKAIASVLKVGDIVIYESTVYPGATEEFCVPILEEYSGLDFNHDFYVGYSPERINPGDKENTLSNIVKVTSGSNAETAYEVNSLYGEIIKAGTHLAASIKVAEAAKVIENTQRDMNIAIINEFAKIFNLIGIDTQQVLNAAGTKWNFLPFKPGLVGGHCISVDPYYLTHKAKEIGYHPEVILSGRRINDGMGEYVATQMIKALSAKGVAIDNSKVLIMGFTFKGNCPDVRNTKIVDVYRQLKLFSTDVDVYDPWADDDEVREEYGIELIRQLKPAHYDGVVLAVDHKEFFEMGEEKIRELCRPNHVIYDLKYVLDMTASDIRL